MDEKELKFITDEIRAEFQIPPFFDDYSLMNYIKEGLQELINIVPTAEFINDLVARSILKNYVFYAYNKKLDDFFINYNPNILRWQLSKCKLT